MTTYQTKPQTVEAVQWRGDNEPEIIAFFPEGTKFVWGPDNVGVVLPGASTFLIHRRQWVVRFDVGQYGRFSDESFRDKYEEKP